MHHVCMVAVSCKLLCHSPRFRPLITTVLLRSPLSPLFAPLCFELIDTCIVGGREEMLLPHVEVMQFVCTKDEGQWGSAYYSLSSWGCVSIFNPSSESCSIYFVMFLSTICTWLAISGQSGSLLRPHCFCFVYQASQFPLSLAYSLVHQLNGSHLSNKVII